MSKARFAFSFFVVFFLSLSAFAQNIDFGAEFVFTNDKMISQTQAPTQIVTEEGKAKFQLWAAKLREYCQSGGGCETKKGTVKGNESIKVTFTDGFWIEVSPDPSVLEVTMLKGNAADYRTQKDRVESLVFGMARELGLYVHDRVGGGHITVDLLSAFRGNAKDFRNFLVDYANHPELAWGVLGNHIGNAPPISALDRKSKEAFYDLIREFDRNPTDIQTLANNINKRVYTSNPFNWQSYGHYQAIRLDQAGRMELRGFAPQKSFSDFQLLIDLIEKRIQFLSRLNHPIEPQLAKSEKMAPAERVARAESYFSEMGLDINDYKSVIIADHRDVQPAPELRPLAENMNSLGQAKKPYYGVDLLYSQTSEKDHKNFKANSEKLSGGERYLVPYPKMISEDEKETLMKGTEQRGRAMMAFLRDLQGDQAFLKQGDLSLQVVERIMKNNNATWDMVKNRMSESMGFIYAPDVVKSSDGRYVILEDNVSGNAGGLGDAKQSREDFLKLMPEFQALLNTENGEGFAQRAADFLRRHSDGKAVVFLLPADAVTFNQFYIKQLVKAGIYVIPKGAQNMQIDMRPAKPVVNVIENGKIVRSQEIGAVFHRGYGVNFRTEYPNTMKAAVEGRIKLMGYVAFDFLDDKELSPHVEKMIRFFLKEEPILRFAQTVPLSRVNDKGSTVADKETLERIFENLERWVIKDTTGLQGKGVWIGQFVKDKKELKDYVLKNPGSFIAQEYVPVSRINRWISDIRIHSMVLGNDAVASDVFWGRAVSIFDNGKLNTHQNAGAIPIFVENRDTVSLEVRQAMTDLFQAKDIKAIEKALDILSRQADSRFRTVIAEWFEIRKDVSQKLVEHYSKNQKAGLAFYRNQAMPVAVRSQVRSEAVKVAQNNLAKAKTADQFLSAMQVIATDEKLARSIGYQTREQFEKLNPSTSQRELWVKTTGQKLIGLQWRQQQQKMSVIRCEMVYR